MCSLLSRNCGTVSLVAYNCLTNDCINGQGRDVALSCLFPHSPSVDSFHMPELKKFKFALQKRFVLEKEVQLEYGFLNIVH